MFAKLPKILKSCSSETIFPTLPDRLLGTDQNGIVDLLKAFFVSRDGLPKALNAY